MAGKNSSAPSVRGDKPRAFGAFCVKEDDGTVRRRVLRYDIRTLPSAGTSLPIWLGIFWTGFFVGVFYCQLGVLP